MRFYFLSQNLLLLKHDFRQEHVAGIMNSKPFKYIQVNQE